MRKLISALLSRFRQGLIGGLVGLGLGSFLVGPAALALVVPQSFAPRFFQTEQTHYVRVTFAFNTCTLAANTCTFKIPAALPYNAAVIRVTAIVHTAFNSATTDTFSLGTTLANANEIVAAGASVHAQAIVATTVLATASSATGVGATQSGVNGGFDLFLKYSQTGAAPSAGLAAIVIEYVAPNDGNCTAVPMGATAAGC